MPLDTSLQDSALLWLKGTAFPSAPAELWLSLHSDTAASGGGDVSGHVGGRLPVNQSFLSAPATPEGESAKRFITNTQAIVSAALADAGITVASYGLHDAVSGGNRLLWGVAPVAFTVALGNPVVILQGGLKLTLN